MQLAELEALKQLKARYFRFVDYQQWGNWGALFDEDAILRFEDECWRGRDQIVNNCRKAFAGATTVHHGHTPDITLTSGTAATGYWAMFDYVQKSTVTRCGTAHGNAALCQLLRYLPAV